MDDFEFGSNDFGDYTSRSKTLRNITWASTPETLAKIATGIRYRYLKLNKTKQEILETQKLAGDKVLKSRSKIPFIGGKPLTDIIDNEIAKVMKYADAVDAKFLKISALFYQKQIKQIKKDSFVVQTVNKFFADMKSHGGLKQWLLKLNVKDPTFLNKELKDAQTTIAAAFPDLLKEIGDEDADIDQDVRTSSSADAGGGGRGGSFSGLSTGTTNTGATVWNRSGGNSVRPLPPLPSEIPTLYDKRKQLIDGRLYKVGDVLLRAKNGGLVPAFGRRRRGSKRVSGRRRRSNPQAAKAMRLMRSEGISLKDAWAQVKGGRGSKRRGSKRRGSKRIKGVLKRSRRRSKRGRRKKSRKIVAFVNM